MATVHQSTMSRNRAKKARDLESIAQLLEDMIPNFKREEERRFYGEMVESYRLAAHDILRESSSINQNGKCHWTTGKEHQTSSMRRNNVDLGVDHPWFDCRIHR
jgi:hypothetical protein